MSVTHHYYLAGISAGARDYLHWFDVADPARRGADMVSDDSVDATFAAISGALPVAGDGESEAAAVDRALADPLWTDPGTSGRILEPVAEAYLGPILGDLVGLPTRQPDAGAPARLTLQPGARMAMLPWELLPLPDGRRLADVADVSAMAGSLPLLWQRQRQPQPTITPDRPLRLVDPATGRPVVHRTRAAKAWHDLLTDQDWQPGQPVTRDDLSDRLRTGAYTRFLFFGHCLPPVAGEPSTMSLLLSDPANDNQPNAVRLNPADPYHLLLPLTAADLIIGLGPEQPGAEIWPMPPRVAIIACDSAGDTRQFEVLGLVPALVNAGAEYITATRWILPADHYSHGATTALAHAVDQAHQQPDPITALQTWQHLQLQRWHTTPHDPANSPLLWAGITTYHAPTIHSDISDT